MTDPIITWTPSNNVVRSRVETYELIDEFTVRRFRTELEQIVATGVESIELNMSQVQMVSSMAICVVISIDGALKKRGGRLRLREVHTGSLEVFSYMRLHELLDIQAASSPELAA